MARQIGVTAFSRDLPETDEAAWSSYLDEIVALGANHVQFLPPEQEKTAKFWGKACADKGLDTSLLWCTFYPDCPTAEHVKALEQAKRAITMARIIAGDKAPTIAVSPSALRCLGDPNRGLPDPDDEKRQLEFLSLLAEFVRTIPGTRVGVEPLNRFETRGPNRVEQVVGMINRTNTSDVLGILGDSCHQGMGERPIVTTWRTFASHFVLLHASSLNRTFLEQDRDLTVDAFRMVASDPVLSQIPVVNEGFCHETNPGFFGLLGMHEPPKLSAVELFRRNLDWLRGVMGK